MKSFLTGFISIGLLSTSLYALEKRDATINIFAVAAKTDKTQDSSSGLGMMFDSEKIKLKIETTSDFFKLGGVYKFNPYDGKWYIKLGANYLKQKMYASDNTSEKVDQYSAAFAAGYMLNDSLYLEAGTAYTDLNGKAFGNYEVKDEKTSLAYVELAKRWESQIGTIDTTANAGEVFHDYTKDEFSYGIGADYYPTNNSKIAYSYQNEKDKIINNYSAQYSYFFIEYIDNISTDTYKANTGIKVAFDNLLDISTWKAPVKIKSHLSELHKFENLTFNTNMNVQSTNGVEETKSSTPAISEPTISMANTTLTHPNYTTDAPSVTNVVAGAVYSFDSNPVGNSLTINQTTGKITWSGAFGTQGTDTIRIKVTNPDGGTSTTTFILNRFITD